MKIFGFDLSELRSGRDRQPDQTAEVQQQSPQSDLYTVTIFAGGFGTFLAGLYTLLQIFFDFFRGAYGKPAGHDDIVTVDMDGDAPGIEQMKRAAAAYNVIADRDATRILTAGRLHVTDTRISSRIGGSRQTSVDDMTAGDPEAGHMVDAVLTPLEASRSRDEGGYGLPRIVKLWDKINLGTRDLQSVIDKIVQESRKGKKILVRIVGSCTGATGATMHNSLPKCIYEACYAANPQLIGNLRIHSVVLLGYAKHPASPGGEGPLLDSKEDDVRVRNFFENRTETQSDRYISRTYLVDGPSNGTACDRYATGGNQGRRTTLGDLYALLALRDSLLKDPFDPDQDGYYIFSPKKLADPDCVDWDAFEDRDFVCTAVNMVRMAAFVWLKLRPLTLSNDYEEKTVAPHIKQMLGRDPDAEALKGVTDPIKALIELSEGVLGMARDLAATGTDWENFAQGRAGLHSDITALFDPYLLDDLLHEKYREGAEINHFALDDLTVRRQGGTKKDPAFTTDQTVIGVYNAACEKMAKKATAAQFLLEIYRQLEV